MSEIIRKEEYKLLELDKKLDKALKDENIDLSFSHRLAFNMGIEDCKKAITKILDKLDIEPKIVKGEVTLTKYEEGYNDALADVEIKFRLEDKWKKKLNIH